MPAFVSSFSTARIAKKEIVSLRSGERVKHFAIGDNKIASEFHVAPIHFKRDGAWLDIDTTLQTEVDKYITYDNKVSVGFRNDGSLSKYLGIRHDESHQFELTLKKLRLNNVVILLPANFNNVEVTSVNGISHTINVNSGIETYVNNTNVKTILKLGIPINDFEITYKVDLAGYTVDNELVGNEYVPDEKNRFNFSDGDKKLWFGQPEMWREGTPTTFTEHRYHRSREINHRLIIDSGELLYIKSATESGKDWLTLSTYPIYIDANTFYATTNDGYATYWYETSTCNLANWNVVRNALSGTSVDDSSSSVCISGSWVYEKGSVGFDCSRGFFFFDTSTLTSLSTITIGLFYFYPVSVFCETTDDVRIQTGTQATTLVLGSYDDFTGVSWGADTNVIEDEYNYISLSSPNTQVIKNGITKVCMRNEDYDYTSGVYPTTDNYIFINSANASNKPYLYITWAPGTPTLGTLTFGSIGENQFTCYSSITSTAGISCSERGFVLKEGTGQTPTLGDYDFKFTDTGTYAQGDCPISFNKVASGLSAGTTYSVRAYTKNSYGPYPVGYSSTVEQATSSPSYETASYSGQTFRTLSESTVYDGETNRTISKLSSYVGDTQRLIGKLSSYIGDTLRDIISLALYNGVTNRTVPKLDQYVGEALRYVVSESLYSAQTSRVISKLSSYIGATNRTISKVANYVGTTVRNVGKLANYIGTTLRSVSKVANYVAQTSRTLSKVATYVGTTIRNIAKVALYTAQTNRLISKVISYVGATLRNINSTALYIAQTNRTISKVISYTGATLRGVVKGAGYVGSSLRIVVSLSEYIATTARNISNIATYIGQTVREVLVGNAAEYIASAVRFVTKPTTYTGVTSRTLGKLSSYTGTTLRSINSIASYIGQTTRITYAAAVFYGVTSRVLGKASTYVGETLRTIIASDTYVGQASRYVIAQAGYVGQTSRNLIAQFVAAYVGVTTRTLSSISSYIAQSLRKLSKSSVYVGQTERDVQDYKPIAVTMTAINITGNSARIRGKIDNDKGFNCEARFRWRKLGDGWTETTWQNSLVTDSEYYEDLAGLDPDSTYEFQTQARGVSVK